MEASEQDSAQKRLEKRMRSRWCRMFLSMHAAHCRRACREALREVVKPRDAAAEVPETQMASHCVDEDEEIGAVDEVLAAELGLDVATFRLLRELEQREILPEDYDLLGRLDEAVKPKTLCDEDLARFATKKYVAPVLTSKASFVDFGLDYWRLPLPTLEESAEENGGNSRVDSFGADFWRLPVAMLQDCGCASSDGAHDNGSSYAHSMDVCGVCLVDFDDGDELRVLPCGHYFHKECIDHWLLNSATVCPIDKRDLQHAY